VLPTLEQQLADGQLRVVALFDKVRTRIVDEEEIRLFDPSGDTFFNMNTPHDYEEALRRWNGSPGSPEEPIRCTVELYGVARLVAQTREVSLLLPAGATIADALAALVDRLPVLAQGIVGADGTTLADGYACNVNGLDFVRDARTLIRDGDNIAIVSADAGG
jgi:molybdopterin converting factor small subunit